MLSRVKNVRHGFTRINSSSESSVEAECSRYSDGRLRHKRSELKPWTVAVHEHDNAHGKTIMQFGSGALGF